MSGPDPEIVKAVTKWLKFADEDLKLASCALASNMNGPYRLIAFHAQQCAEKCIKAFLIYQNVDFPYTHNIRRLLKLCGKYATWAETLVEAEELTPYAITARYPGEDEPVSESEATRAVKIAKSVRETVLRSLEEAGLELR